MADFESLVIRVKSQSKPAGKPKEWAPLGNMATFTKDISTPTLAKGADMSAIVSGIPTIFARINLFTNAISYSATSLNRVGSGICLFSFIL